MSLQSLPVGVEVHDNTMVNIKYICSVVYAVVKKSFKSLIKYDSVGDEFQALLFTEAELQSFYDSNSLWFQRTLEAFESWLSGAVLAFK